jgi:hypothetical protein
MAFDAGQLGARTLLQGSVGKGVHPLAEDREIAGRALSHQSDHRLVQLVTADLLDDEGGRGHRFRACPNRRDLEHRRVPFRFVPERPAAGGGSRGILGRQILEAAEHQVLTADFSGEPQRPTGIRGGSRNDDRGHDRIPFGTMSEGGCPCARGLGIRVRPRSCHRREQTAAARRIGDIERPRRGRGGILPRPSLGEAQGEGRSELRIRQPGQGRHHVAVRDAASQRGEMLDPRRGLAGGSLATLPMLDPLVIELGAGRLARLRPGPANPESRRQWQQRQRDRTSPEERLPGTGLGAGFHGNTWFPCD